MIQSDTTNDLQSVLMDTVRKRGDLTIPGLLNVLEHAGCETQGEYQTHFPNRPNTVIWTGMSENAARTISTFLGRQDVGLHPLGEFETVVIFGFDGVPFLTLPVGTNSAKQKDFEDPHWIPLTVKAMKAGQLRPTPTHPLTNQPATRVAFTRMDRVAVWNKTHGLCWYCGIRTNPFEDFTIDHVHPVADGGANSIANLVPCCRTCNSAKRDRPLEVFRQARGGGMFWYEIVLGQGK